MQCGGITAYWSRDLDVLEPGAGRVGSGLLFQCLLVLLLPVHLN